MPITKKGKKWAISPRAKAVYKTKKDAEKALRAYYAQKRRKK